MKKVVFFVGLLLSAMAFSGCSKENPDQQGTDSQNNGMEEPLTVHAYFAPFAGETRTVTKPDGKIQWVPGDVMWTYVKPAGSSVANGYKMYTSEANYKQSIFEFADKNKVPSLDEKGTNDWYFIYNGSRGNSPASTFSDAEVNFSDVTIDCNDPMAHLAQTDILAGYVQTEGKASPEVRMYHMGTMVKYTLVNRENFPITIHGMKMDTECPINGIYRVNYMPNTESGLSLGSGREIKRNCTATMMNSPELAPNESLDVYLVLKPFTVTNGDYISVSVYSTAGTFVQTSEMLDMMFFKEGEISTSTIYVQDSQSSENALFFPSAELKKFLVAHYDTDADQEISQTEADHVTSLVLDINSFEGIEHLRNLEELVISHDDMSDSYREDGGKLTVLNISQNKKLKSLRIRHQRLLRSLDLSANPALEIFNCEDCPMMDSYRLPEHSSLIDFTSVNNSISTIEGLERLSKLRYLTIKEKITEFDVPKSQDLELLTLLAPVTSMKLENLPQLHTVSFHNPEKKQDFNGVLNRDLMMDSLVLRNLPNLRYFYSMPDPNYYTTRNAYRSVILDNLEYPFSNINEDNLAISHADCVSLENSKGSLKDGISRIYLSSRFVFDTLRIAPAYLQTLTNFHLQDCYLAGFDFSELGSQVEYLYLDHCHLPMTGDILDVSRFGGLQYLQVKNPVNLFSGIDISGCSGLDIYNMDFKGNSKLNMLKVWRMSESEKPIFEAAVADSFDDSSKVTIVYEE